MDFGRWPSCWKSSKISSNHKLHDRLIYWGFPIPYCKASNVKVMLKLLCLPEGKGQDSKTVIILAPTGRICARVPWCSPPTCHLLCPKELAPFSLAFCYRSSMICLPEEHPWSPYAGGSSPSLAEPGPSRTLHSAHSRGGCPQPAHYL